MLLYVYYLPYCAKKYIAWQSYVHIMINIASVANETVLHNHIYFKNLFYFNNETISLVVHV